MTNYIKTNFDYWDREYHSPNVESFIFRLKSYLLDKHFPKNKKLTMLDFGCGQGSTIKYFINTYGYDAYGVDISKKSINVAKKNISKKRFKLINSQVDNTENFFNKKFDLIISIQTLYYLNNTDLKSRLNSLNKMLKKNGLVFFTMMSKKNNYFKKYSNKKNSKDGMTFVDLAKDKYYIKRQKLTSHMHFINFVKNEVDLKKKLKIFKPLAIGSYDMRLESLDKSEHHYTFLGKKR
jgi:cyclopropane fatty-acyl-phospholipid synthase-like methyltransferase